jgi:uncharacterized protein YgiB involved in biofilm formation
MSPLPFPSQPPRPSAGRPMKRSRRLAMTTVMATAGVSLVACDNNDVGRTAQWQDPPAQVAQGPAVDAFAYPTLQACFDANKIPDDACREAALAAIKDNEAHAPRYDAKDSCEDVYGAGQCVPRNAQGGGSFFTPLLTGFIVGQMLNGGGFRGTGLYRDYRDGSYTTGYGGRVFTDYSTGRTKIGANGIDPPDAIKAAPPKMQTRASVISRGGFGGRMSASSGGYSGGHWGG